MFKADTQCFNTGFFYLAFGLGGLLTVGGKQPEHTTCAYFFEVYFVFEVGQIPCTGFVLQEVFFEKKNPAFEGYLAILSLVILLLFVAGLIKK